MSRPKMWGEHVADGWYEVVDAETLELFEVRRPYFSAIPKAGEYPEGDYSRAIYIDEDGRISQAVSRADGYDNPIPFAVLRRVVEATEMLLAGKKPELCANCDRPISAHGHTSSWTTCATPTARQ